MENKTGELKLGYSCNNNCIFCFVRHKKGRGDLSLEQIKKKIKFLRNKGISYVELSGGEPTIRKDILSIFSFIKQNGMGIGIHTNARLFSYHEFALKSSNYGLIRALVSVQDYRENMHDEITRAPNSLKQTISGIKNLINCGIKVKTNTLITTYNVQQLKKMSEKLNEIGVKEMQFVFPESYEGKINNLKITPQYYLVMKHLKKTIHFLEKKGVDISIRGIPYCILGKYGVYAFDETITKSVLDINELCSNPSEIDSLKKIKIDICFDCDKEKKCNGFYKHYISFFGDSKIRNLIKKTKKQKFKTMIKTHLLPFDILQYNLKKFNKIDETINITNWSSDLNLILKKLNASIKNSEYHDFLETNNKKQAHQYLSRNISGISNSLLIGGEHTISYFLISKFLEKNPNSNIIIFDAHLDIKDRKKKCKCFGRSNWLTRLMLIKKKATIVHIGGHISSFYLNQAKYLSKKNFIFYPIKNGKLMKLCNNGKVKRISKKDINNLRFLLKDKKNYLSIDVDAFMNTCGLWSEETNNYLKPSELPYLLKDVPILAADILEIASFKGLNNIKNIINQTLKLMHNFN